jgi:hypothetical protein
VITWVASNLLTYRNTFLKENHWLLRKSLRVRHHIILR